MVDSRDKGKRAEYDVRDLLREKTELGWERVPGSGGFGAQHGLKGDIYLPISTNRRSLYCIEVKHYKDDTITSNLANNTVSTLEKWWDQTVRESGEMNSKPMLVFKKDRGEWLMALWETDDNAAYLMDQSFITFRSSRMTHAIIIGKFKPWLSEATLEDLVV